MKRPVVVYQYPNFSHHNNKKKHKPNSAITKRNMYTRLPVVSQDVKKYSNRNFLKTYM